MAYARSTRFASIAAVLAAGATVAVVQSAHTLTAAAALDLAVGFVRSAKIAIAEGYRVAPALMLGLALSIGLPLAAFLMRLNRHPLALSSETTRRCRQAGDDAPDAEIARELVIRVSQPFVEFEVDGRAMRYTILGDMLRIGREDDNDICIPMRGVERYHAAIYREDYDDWHIADLSGTEGKKGLIVNGRRCNEAELSDGDLIRLGPGKVRFRAGPA